MSVSGQTFFLKCKISILISMFVLMLPQVGVSFVEPMDGGDGSLSEHEINRILDEIITYERRFQERKTSRKKRGTSKITITPTQEKITKRPFPKPIGKRNPSGPILRIKDYDSNGGYVSPPPAPMPSPGTSRRKKAAPESGPTDIEAFEKYLDELFDNEDEPLKKFNEIESSEEFSKGDFKLPGMTSFVVAVEKGQTITAAVSDEYYDEVDISKSHWKTLASKGNWVLKHCIMDLRGVDEYEKPKLTLEITGKKIQFRGNLNVGGMIKIVPNGMSIESLFGSSLESFLMSGNKPSYRLIKYRGESSYPNPARMGLYKLVLRVALRRGKAVRISLMSPSGAPVELGHQETKRLDFSETMGLYEYIVDVPESEGNYRFQVLGEDVFFEAKVKTNRINYLLPTGQSLESLFGREPSFTEKERNDDEQLISVTPPSKPKGFGSNGIFSYNKLEIIYANFTCPPCNALKPRVNKARAILGSASSNISTRIASSSPVGFPAYRVNGGPWTAAGSLSTDEIVNLVRSSGLM